MKTSELQLNEYLGYCEKVRNFTAQTMRSKRYILNRFIEEIEVENMLHLTCNDVDSWRMKTIESGVSQRTVNCRVAHVIAFLRYLQEVGNTLSLNPASLRMAKCEPTSPVFYSVETINNVLEQCISGREVILISVAFEAGLRLSELVNLRFEDVDFQRLTIFGKGRKKRITYVTENTAQNIKLYKEDYKLEGGYLFPSKVNRFSKYSEKHMSVDNARYVMKRAFNRAGVNNFYPHSLRHSFATTLLKSGADLTTIQNLLGHTNVATTSKYLHLVDGELKERYVTFMRTANVQY